MRRMPLSNNDRLSGNMGPVDKPPKLRFKPGSFVRDKKTKQLYCIRVAFRLREDPHVWYFELEERDDSEAPQIKSELAEIIQQQIAKPILDACVVLPIPLHNSMDVARHELCRDMYHYGNSKMVNNKSMLNDYEVIK